MAAARVKLFTPEQIAERLDDRFKLLTGGSRTALPRQQTLRALIDWSYQSLNETEQRVLRRLAVFSGGWTFEAAESVIGELDALEGLLGLVNKSLVNVEEQDGKSRYRFLETIRQYAMEKLLESGKAIEIRNRHLDYFLQSTAEGTAVYKRIFGQEDIEWLDRTEVEHDNLRAALEWSISSHPGKALHLAYILGSFWVARDYNHESRAWCRTILERTKSRQDLDRERASVYGIYGWSSIAIGDHKTGRDAAEAGLALARKVQDLQTTGRLLALLGLASTFLGDFLAAETAIIEAEALAREKGTPEEVALMITTRAQMIYFAHGDVPQAKKYLDEAISLGETTQLQWATTMSIFGMARLAGAMGDLDRARRSFLESADFAKRVGNKRLMYSCYSELAHVLREHGELDEPLAIYRDLLPKWKDLGHRAAVAHELECIGYILAKKNHLQRAAVVLGAADALRQLIDSSPMPAEQVEYKRELAALREKTDEMQFRQAWDEGQKLRIDEAVACAMEEV